MQRKPVIIILMVFAFQRAFSAEADYSSIDRKIILIPDSYTNSSQSIANYINDNFASESEKVRAIYAWITQNIRYDIYLSQNYTISQSQKITQVLRTRKGICDGYVALFQDLCSKSGIDCQVIKGYTKKNGIINPVSHAWCASRINGIWQLFDPTWGAGVVSNGKFIFKRNNAYFMTPPQVMINTHMPFDPMWQLLTHPVTSREFARSESPSASMGNYFNYNDSISQFEKQNEDQRIITSLRRIERNGITNSLVSKRVSSMREELWVRAENRVINQYNLALSHYNNAIKSYNKVVQYRNQGYQYYPKTNIISKIIVETERDILSANEILSGICDIPCGIHTEAQSLLASVDKLKHKLDRQKNQ